MDTKPVRPSRGKRESIPQGHCRQPRARGLPLKRTSQQIVLKHVGKMTAWGIHDGHKSHSENYRNIEAFQRKLKKKKKNRD